MSQLRQYEIHFIERCPESVYSDRVALEWAYTAEDALRQFELRCNYAHRNVRLKEIGPVRLAVGEEVLTAGMAVLHKKAHFHVCHGCEKVAPCRHCPNPHDSRSFELCIECSGKKPHDHFCGICGKDVPCATAAAGQCCLEKRQREMFCGKHSYQEAQEFLAKKVGRPTGL